MQDASLLVAKIMAAIPAEGMVRKTIRARLLRKACPAGDPEGEGLWLPEGMSGVGFLDYLVRRGVLQDCGTGRYSYPIPSLRRFLIEQGGLAPVQAAARIRYEPDRKAKSARKIRQALLPLASATPSVA